MAIRGWRGDLTPEELDKQKVKPGQIPPSPRLQTKYVVVDIDGTLFDVRTRWKIAAQQAKPPSPKFWGLFMNPEYLQYDTPNEGAAKVLREIKRLGFNIVYISGRRTNMLEHTRRQLKNHNFPEGIVVLRNKGRPTENFKISVLNRLKYEGRVIVYIGDDSIDDYVGQETKTPTVRVSANKSWTNGNVENIVKHIEKSVNT